MLAVTAWLISVTPASLRRITSNLLLFADAWPVWNRRIGLVLLVLRVNRGRPVVIRTDITDYRQFERTLRRRLAPDLQARWKEARDT